MNRGNCGAPLPLDDTDPFLRVLDLERVPCLEPTCCICGPTAADADDDDDGGNGGAGVCGLAVAVGPNALLLLLFALWKEA